MKLFAFVFPRFSQEMMRSVSSARTKTLRPINQQGNKVQTFFLARTTFHLRRLATVSCNLFAKRRGALQPREPNQLSKAITVCKATPYDLVIPHSYTYATLSVHDRGERQSGSERRGSGHCSVARGTRNIRFRNELTLRPSDNPPSYVGRGIPRRDEDR